jgi:hypothetical protein
VEEACEKWCGRDGRGAVVEETGPSHPGGIGSGVEENSSNTGAGSRAGAGGARIRETRAEQDTCNCPDVRTLVFPFFYFYFAFLYYSELIYIYLIYDMVNSNLIIFYILQVAATSGLYFKLL